MADRISAWPRRMTGKSLKAGYFQCRRFVMISPWSLPWIGLARSLRSMGKGCAVHALSRRWQDAATTIRGRENVLTHKKFDLFACSLSALLLLPSFAVAVERVSGMVALADEVMQNITGQEGVSLDIEVRLNTDANGVPLTTLSSCAGNNNPCKLGIAFNNRPNLWLMLKDYYGTINIPKLYIDKTNAPATVSAYKDLTRFQDGAGGCLLGAGKTTACVDADIQNQPALKLSAPGVTGTFENDILMNLFVGRVAIESGATGYDNDANGTFLGLQLRDTSTSAPQARIDVDGHIAMFGF